MCKTDGQVMVRRDYVFGSLLMFFQVKVVCILQIRGRKGILTRLASVPTPKMEVRHINALYRGFMGFQGLLCSILNLIYV